jgi:hypothetical protein
LNILVWGLLKPLGPLFGVITVSGWVGTYLKAHYVYLNHNYQDLYPEVFDYL